MAAVYGASLSEQRAKLRDFSDQTEEFCDAGAPVSDGRFGSLSFLPGDVFVKVGQAAGHRLGYVAQLRPADDVSLQEV